MVMDHAYWLRQTDKPLFPELEWSRPETKLQAGKLLIAGGNAHGFAAPAESYGLAQKAGIGSIRVLLPDVLGRAVGKVFPEAEFAPSTPGGSFAANALAELLAASRDINGVLLPGDISRNSETTILFESFLKKYTGQVTLTKDVADIFCQQPISILNRPDTLLVVAMGQLRRLGTEAHFKHAFTSEMGIVSLVDALHDFTSQSSLHIVTKHQRQFIVASKGSVSTTSATEDQPIWRTRLAATMSVWWLQNPNKTFEALTASIFEA